MKHVDPNKYPPGLDYKKVKAIIDYYDNQSEDEAIAEMEEGLAVMAGNRVIQLESAISKKIFDLARERKTTVEKLLNSMLKKTFDKVA
ncbi:MAG: hypothetical protein HQM09_19020 [Candidatus Riflebacteria bacterium]|nr:hypothetical protein [Candidatus Riflebacteria bacterium]